MSALATYKTYWAGNGTLNTALPASKIYLDYVPPGTSFPYARLTVLASIPTYLTGGTHVETFTYQLGIFNTDLDALCATGDSIMGVLDQSYPTAGTLIHTRRNRIMTGDVVNGVYTYNLVLEYDWVYNSALA